MASQRTARAKFFEGRGGVGKDQGSVVAAHLAEEIHPEGTAEVLDLRRAFFEHGQRIRSFLERLGHPRADAEDLVSEAFLIAHERRDRFDPSRPMLPWLFGIAINASKKHRRRQWMKRLLQLALASELADRTGDDLERTLVEREDRGRVRRTLAEMPESKRTLLLLREYEELSAEEIGLALDMPVNSVYSALHYARKEFLRRYRQKKLLEESR
jgi:RNA polymerase sigma-70 factor, ECF subfamily